MGADERVLQVTELLVEYAQSPSLRHIRHHGSLQKLAQEIVARLDRGDSIWTKWYGRRDSVAKSAIGCWIPLSDLRDFLNRMPGPKLTLTDVSQRMAALEQEDPYFYPKPELQEGCLAIYEGEKSEGTDLPAILGLLRGHVELEEQSAVLERERSYRQARDKARTDREQRLQSGADCGWTQVDGSRCWYCRKNGRAYRLSPTKDRRWLLHRVEVLSSEGKGIGVGTYGGRADASRAIAQVAYRPEPP